MLVHLCMKRSVPPQKLHAVPLLCHSPVFVPWPCGHIACCVLSAFVMACANVLIEVSMMASALTVTAGIAVGAAATAGVAWHTIMVVPWSMKHMAACVSSRL